MGGCWLLLALVPRVRPTSLLQISDQRQEEVFTFFHYIRSHRQFHGIYPAGEYDFNSKFYQIVLLNYQTDIFTGCERFLSDVADCPQYWPDGDGSQDRAEHEDCQPW